MYSESHSITSMIAVLRIFLFDNTFCNTRHNFPLKFTKSQTVKNAKMSREQQQKTSRKRSKKLANCTPKKVELNSTIIRYLPFDTPYILYKSLSYQFDTLT
jgi:hypothetical protein